MSAKKKSKKKLNLSVDEWNVVYRPHGKIPPDAKWTKAPHQIEDVYNLEDALLVGTIFITMLNHADRVKIACQAQLANVIAPIMTSDKGAWRQTIFYPFMHCSKYAKGKVLKNVVDCDKYDSQNYTDVPYVSSAVVYNEEDDTLVIFAVNRSLDEDILLESDLRQFDGYRVKDHIILTNDDLKAVNTEDNEAVKPESAINKSVIDGGILESAIPAHSWNVIIFGK